MKSKITFSYKNWFSPSPRCVLKVVNAVQSCCAMVLGMAIYQDQETLLWIVSTVSIACHFINSCSGTRDNRT